MEGGLSLKEDLVELSLDIDAILTQTIAVFVDCAKKRNTVTAMDDNLAHLTSLFSNKSDQFKEMVRKVNYHYSKERYIQSLKESVKRRDEFICSQTEKLSDAFKAISNANYNGQKALKKAKAESKTFEPEEVIRLSHLISKNFSVASPHYWQQGDPSRPFPTELQFRISNFGNHENGIKDPKDLSISLLSTSTLNNSLSNNNNFGSNDIIIPSTSEGISSTTTTFLPLPPGSSKASTDGNLRDIKTMNGLPSIFNDYNNDDNQRRGMELILPSSSSSINNNAIGGSSSLSEDQPTTINYSSGLMSSDEDDDDDESEEEDE